MQTIDRRPLLSLVVLVAALTCAIAYAAEPSLRFETTVPFSEGKRVPLDAKVGPVRVTAAIFSVSPPGASESGLMGRIRGELHRPTETQSLVRLRLEAENPELEEWEVSVTVELLDAKGALIDRLYKSESLEGEAKTFYVEQPVLTYVLPSIAKATVRLAAKLD